MQTLVSEHLICTSCHYLADIMEIKLRLQGVRALRRMTEVGASWL